jgi:ATP-dependent DNA helicase RecG
MQNSSFQYLKGVGPKRAEAFASEKIYTPKDLLFCFPRSYIDISATNSLKALAVKLIEEKSSDPFSSNSSSYKTETTVVAKIFSIEKKKYGKKGYVKLIVNDFSGGKAELMFWNNPDYIAKQYQVGDLISISGRAEIDSYNKITFHHPDLQLFDDETEENEINDSISPVYKIHDSWRKVGINSKIIKNIIKSCLDSEVPKIKESLPNSILEKYRFCGIQDAIRLLHFPESREQIKLCNLRMKYEEIFYFELYLALRNRNVIIEEEGVFIPAKSALARSVYESLPFDLTSDQKKVIREIVRDMESGKPMNRLLQGDVGSGKTIVSTLCMLSVIDSGYQAAIMAPTEILAEQHFHTFQKFLEGKNINIVQLVGGQRKKLRTEILERIRSGDAQIIIGTHSLFDSNVEYNKLGLIVIDEQHRFGVDQRAKLKELAKSSHSSKLSPHILVMSATPIPRTLALTVYGDLNVSVIKQLPKNRIPIKTKVVFERALDQSYEFIKQELNGGRQAYIVFPLVEKSEKLELKSAVEHFDYLSQEVFSEYKCGLLHGQMLWYEKEDALKDFLDKKYDILISTTVIEVGIDVPNATIMLINNAERFGLSQLHQLRGRVGRSGYQSYCLLATKDHFQYQLNSRSKDKDSDSKANVIRLKTMERTSDGFEIAEVDLKLRGPGDVLGTRQSGLPTFKFLDLACDGEIVEAAKFDAFEIVKEDPTLTNPQNSILKREYERLYKSEYNYFDIA